jgi:hypothetical protein
MDLFCFGLFCFIIHFRNVHRFCLEGIAVLRPCTIKTKLWNYVFNETVLLCVCFKSFISVSLAPMFNIWYHSKPNNKTIAKYKFGASFISPVGHTHWFMIDTDGKQVPRMLLLYKIPQLASPLMFLALQPKTISPTQFKFSTCPLLIHFTAPERCFQWSAQRPTQWAQAQMMTQRGERDT